MKKHYVVIPSNTDLNRGDQALIWESIRLSNDSGLIGDYYLLESGLNDKEVELQSWQTKERGYKFISPVLLHPGRNKEISNKNYMYNKKQLVGWGLQAISDLIISRCILSKNKKIYEFGINHIDDKQLKALNIIKTANAIIVKGGGFIHSYGKITDFYYMYYSLYHIYLAKRFGIPVIIMPNSYGPFKGMFIKRLVKKAFEGVSIITSRETISTNQLRNDLDLDVEVMPDLGFYLMDQCSINAKEYLDNLGVPLGIKKCVGITLRPYRFPKSNNPKEAYKNYINSIVELTKWMNKSDYHLVMVAHTLGPSKHEDDRIAINDVLININDKSNITVIEDSNFNCNDLKSIYKELDFVIGTRFHSVIFAMSSGTPAIAISYGGNKGKGIMNDIGIGKYEIDIENINFESIKNKLISLDSEKDMVKERINNYMKKAIIKREEFKEIISKKIVRK